VSGWKGQSRRHTVLLKGGNLTRRRRIVLLRGPTPLETTAVLLRGGKPNNGDAGRSDCRVCHHIGGKPRSQPTASRANVGLATDTVANSFRAVFSAARVGFATPSPPEVGQTWSAPSALERNRTGTPPPGVGPTRSAPFLPVSSGPWGRWLAGRGGGWPAGAVAGRQGRRLAGRAGGRASMKQDWPVPCVFRFRPARRVGGWAPKGRPNGTPPGERSRGCGGGTSLGLSYSYSLPGHGQRG